MQTAISSAPRITADPSDHFRLINIRRVPESIAEFIKRLKTWRLNDLQQSLLERARGEVPRSDPKSYQKAQIRWIERFIASVIDLFPKRRGRPVKPEGAQTAAERQSKHRQREKDWGWLRFPIIPHAGYLVMEASLTDPAPAFDARHGTHIMIGFELQQMMDAHHREYPGQKYKPDEWRPGMETEYHTILGEADDVLALEYPDKVVYIVPALEKPSGTADVLAATLNRGMFLTDAPSGKGKLVTGWGQKKGYDKNRSAFEPGLDDVGDFYADEFANENDDNDDSPSAQPGEFADPDKRELDFGNPDRRKLFEDPTNPKLRDPNELDEAVEKYEQDNREDESADGEPKCRICKEVLEGDDEESDDTLLMKHLKDRHLDEYQRICAMWEESWRKERTKKQNRLRRLLEKQKYCRAGLYASHIALKH
jgi:hypothetical protein